MAPPIFRGQYAPVGETITMPHLKYDLDKIRPWHGSARYCQHCGRREELSWKTCCHQCGRNLQKSSRWEWHLADALRDELSNLAEFTLVEQWPLQDRSGFYWYFDLYVAVGSYREVIEVNGSSHDTVDGRSHDDRKACELKAQYPTVGLRVVRNTECTKQNAPQTARKIARELVKRSNSWP